jgi:protein ImuB
VQSEWRVACVRIPRFPIGAVWRAARRGEIGEPTPDAQLLLPLTLPDAAPPRTSSSSLPPSSAPPSPAPEHWDEHPIALIDVSGKRLRAVTAAAARAGLRAGMRPAEARALCADLVELPWDDVAIDAAITEASAALLSAGPQVSPVAGAPGLWWVGALGFDPVGGERALAVELLRVAKRWHPRPRVAIAGSCVAARAATWAGASFDRHASERSLVYVVPAGHDAAYLAPAPLALVPMDEELRAALHALGLRTVGALAALSAEDVERRWGDVGIRAWRLARAEDLRRPVLARVETQPAVEVELAASSSTMEPVLFLVRAALDRLVQELIAHGRAAAAVAITLTLDDARGALVSEPVHTVTREVRPARPLARVAPLFERCRALLDRWTLSAPVSAVRVAIVAAAPLTGEQGDLLSASWRDVGAADAALERLRAELGPNAIVRAVHQDTHRPEKAGVWKDALDVEPVARTRDMVRDDGGCRSLDSARDDSGRSLDFTRDDSDGHPERAKRVEGSAPALPTTNAANGSHTLRMVREPEPLPTTTAAHRTLEPAEPVDVECEGEVPRVVTWRGHRIPVSRPIGPERLSGDWWDDGYRRDYWRCESLAGEFVVYLDRADDAWRLQGWVD